jgi:hypothetical protein
MNKDPAVSTTSSSNTCIDDVFTRHVEHLQTINFISYFSYHKPLLSITAQPHSDTCNDVPVQWFLGRCNNNYKYGRYQHWCC